MLIIVHDQYLGNNLGEKLHWQLWKNYPIYCSTNLLFFVCLIFRSYLRSSTPVIVHTDDDAIMTIQLADLHKAEDKYHFWVESTKFGSITK